MPEMSLEREEWILERKPETSGSKELNAQRGNRQTSGAWVNRKGYGVWNPRNQKMEGHKQAKLGWL